MPRTTASVPLLALVIAITARPLLAEAPRDASPERIRTTDSRLRRLVHDGRRTSDTFRALVDRLVRSDLVVYLECDGTFKPAGGRLTFVSAAGGYRYLLVRVTRLRSEDQQIAMIGHELRHAVEIADAPAIVDAASLAREYFRIGYLNAGVVTPGVTFDSDAAVQAGYQVLRELLGVAGD